MDYRRVTFIGWYLLAVFVLMCIVCLFSGCRTQYVNVPEFHYIEKARTDTFVQRDSIHHHDSVMVRVKGDTVYLEKFSVMYRDRWREKAVHDTVIKIDSIRVPYPVERQATRWERLKDWLTMLVQCAVCLIGVIWLLRYLGKRRS